jgi:hypothetical protein
LTHDERNTLLEAATAENPGSSTLDYLDVIGSVPWSAGAETGRKSRTDPRNSAMEFLTGVDDAVNVTPSNGPLGLVFSRTD